MPKPATERRLWDAFAAECAAYMKYTFYAQAAHQEGLEQIAAVFEQRRKTKKPTPGCGCWPWALSRTAPARGIP